MSNITNQHEQSGEIVFIGQPETITANLVKRVIAIQVPNGSRNEFIPFDFYNPTSVLDAYSVGNRVHITYKLKGNRSKTDPSRFFASNEALNIQKL